MRKIFTLLLYLLSISTAFAEIIYVKPGGTGNGTSWSLAYGDLSAALAGASAGDEIWVAQGTYFTSSQGNTATSFNFKDGVRMFGGFSGDEAAISERADATGATTLLSGELDGGLHAATILKINNANSNLNLLDGFTIRGGLKHLTALAHGGAGIQAMNSSLTLKNVYITNNEMLVTNVFSTDEIHVGGAGIYSVDSNLILEDVHVTDNHLELSHTQPASLKHGGTGIYAKGGSLSFYRGSLRANTTNFNGYYVYGGGALLQSQSSINITNVMVSGNTSSSTITPPQGCGLSIYSCPDVKIINSIFHNNYAYHTQGNGSVVNASGNVLTIRSSTAVITNVTFGKNADYSSNFSIMDDYGSNLTFNNCIFTERFDFGSATVSVFNHCISKNSSADNDILSSGNPTLNNFLNASIEFINIEKGNYIPRYCSQHLNAGNNSYNTLETDFLGNPRIVGGNIDYGAIESQHADINTVYVDAASTDAWPDGSSWDKAFSDLSDALRCKCDDNNGTITIPQEVWVAEGTYTPDTSPSGWFTLNKNQKLYGGFTNGATSVEDRNIGYSTMQTILSGELENGTRAVHVVYSANNTIATEINGFIVEKGKADNIAGFGSIAMSGGGVAIDNGSATLKNLWVRDNVSGNPEEYIPGQSFSTGYGGGIYVAKSAQGAASVTMENVRVSNNAGYGGGIAFSNTTNNNFSAALKNIEIYDNISTPFLNGSGNGAGGGIFINGQLNLEMEDFYLANNTANWIGAGISINSNSAPITMKRGIFKQNGSLENVSGGAIFASAFPATTITMESVVFEGNRSEDGAIFAASAHYNFTNCTFTGNESQEGANLFSISDNSNISIRNSIIDSAANGINTIFMSTGSVTAQNCLFKNSLPAQITNLGNVLANTDPLFADPDNSDYQLMQDSPAVDSGVNSFLVLSPGLDASGNIRISNNTVDMGAYEYQHSLSITENGNGTSLALYPNPAKDHFMLTASKAVGSGHIDIYDIRGKSVHRQAIEESILQEGISIETSGWEAGIYLIKWTDGTNSATIKLLKI